MDSKSESDFLKKLNEFVYDEDKVVTFKWLSKSLDLNVEDSKKLLEKYTINNKPKDLEIVFWVSGKFDDDSYHTSLIKQEEFDDKLRKFANVSCKFIYSVYKKNETDFKDLLINCKVSDNVEGTLTSRRCIKRTLKEKAPLPALKATDITKQKHTPSIFSNVAAKSIKSSSENDVKVPINSTTTKKENGAAKGIASFISKMPAKQKAQSDTCISKKSDAKPDKPKSEDIKETKEINDKKQKLIDTDDSEEEKRIPKGTNENQKEKKQKNKRKRNTSNSTAKNKKQRRRIVEPNDSDSDDIFANDDEDEQHQEPLHISDEEEELIYKPKPDHSPTNKKRKLVKETFTDEDGYFMTCKKWISVDDDSGNEKENAVKEDKKESMHDKPQKVKDTQEGNSKSIKKETSSTGNSKIKGNKSKKPSGSQTTLMNFFNKS